jgi:hypothetical protein
MRELFEKSETSNLDENVKLTCKAVGQSQQQCDENHQEAQRETLLLELRT